MTQTKNELRWAFIGASDIAKTRMLKAINSQPNSRVTAVFSSNADRAKAYAAENEIPKAYENLKTLLDDSEIDIVYISTTNDLHRDQALAAGDSGIWATAQLFENTLLGTIGPQGWIDLFSGKMAGTTRKLNRQPRLTEKC
jgi:Oxidoreductase family, NAD-binding Rossmann fold